MTTRSVAKTIITRIGAGLAAAAIVVGTALPAAADTKTPPEYLPATFTGNPGEDVTIEFTFRNTSTHYVFGSYLTYTLPEHTTFKSVRVDQSASTDGVTFAGRISKYNLPCGTAWRGVVRCSQELDGDPRIGWNTAGPVRSGEFIRFSVVLTIDSDAPTGGALDGGTLSASWRATDWTGWNATGSDPVVSEGVRLADELPINLVVPAGVPAVDPAIGLSALAALGLVGTAGWMILRRRHSAEA